MRILGVGIATLDIVNHVDGYPEEDAEVRALKQRLSRGGNATNTLVTLSQLGHECTWAGMLGTDSNSEWVRQDLQQQRVCLDPVSQVDGGVLPTSYVTLNQQNGSRTIVHHRQLEEYSVALFEQIDLSRYDWIHFEGRAVEELGQMMQFLLNQGYSRFSLEVEKVRQGIEDLFSLPSVLMFSRHYVREAHTAGVRAFFSELREKGVTGQLYCAWGKAGGWVMGADNRLSQQPAWQPEQVIDTLGAGDVFNAGVIDAVLKGLTPEQSLKFACKVSGYKCGLEGFNGIACVLSDDE